MEARIVLVICAVFEVFLLGSADKKFLHLSPQRGGEPGPSARQDDPGQLDENLLLPKQAMPHLRQDEADFIPPEDTSLQVIRPAGGEVNRGGAGIVGLFAADREPNSNRLATVGSFGTTAYTGRSTPGPTSTPGSVPTPATMASVGTTAYYAMSTASSTGTPITPSYSVGGGMNTGVSGGTINTAYSAGGGGGTTMTGGVGGYSYAGAPASSSYGSSGTYGSATNAGSSSGTSATGTGNSGPGTPYGFYTQLQYFPYAQNAVNQLTHPLVFVPYLPVPSYINKLFGLNLPLTQGKR